MEAIFLSTYAGFAVVTGACIGSFLNVLIARWPYDASLLPRSHCPSCGSGIRPYDLVPILSYLWLRGKCRDCGASIAPTYPLVELLTALIGWLLFQRFVDGFEDLSLTTLLAWLVYFTFCCAMIVMSYVDLRHSIIPDQTSSWAVPIGVLGMVGLHYAGFEGWPAVSIQQSILGAAGGGLIMALFAILGRVLTGREALGWGDAKLMAMIGAFLGAIPGVWVVLLAGSLLASGIGLLHLIWTRRRSYLPLGPVLGLVSVIYVLFGDVLIPLFLPVSLLVEAIP
ncbi:MAG: prepilin peptidase [Deltaproteobacteria bacterium]|nr:MAG: prepilin peptidase [Deltaproteobacteria bacterium]